MRAVIVDDEKLARDELKFLLEENGDIEIVGEGENGFEALELCRRLGPELLFLDIQMPGKNGIEAAREILDLINAPSILFQTAYDEFALQAFEVHAVDYLLKPISPQRLEKTMRRLRERPSSVGDLERLLTAISPSPRIEHKPLPVYAGETIILLKQEEILFIEAQGKEVRIVSRRGEYRCGSALWQIEKQLSHPDFLQRHRSYLVNISYVERIDLWVNNSFMLALSGVEERIPVSRGQAPEFRKRLNL